MKPVLRAITAAVALLLATASAWPQGAILQGGPWQPGHLPQYVGQGSAQAVLQDGGGAGGGAAGVNPAELGLTARGTGTPPYAGQGSGPFGTIACQYDAPISNAAGYHFLCLSPNAQGGGLLAYGAGGVAAQLPFAFNINGVSYAFPFITSGVVGPNATVVNDLAVWNNTTGTLLKDVPASTVVTAVEPFLDVRSFAQSPLTFATVCTGGDDTATIQAAVNAANTSGGQTIEFPASACHIAAPGINFLNKRAINLRGQGSQNNNSPGSSTTLIYTSATGSLFVMDGAVAIDVGNIAIIYSHASYSGDLIDLRQVSGAQNTLGINIHDCLLFGASGTASSLVRMSFALSIRVERCFLQGAVQLIKGGTSSNNVFIANNWFDKNVNTVSHVGVQGEGWTLLNDTFEPINPAGALNNIVLNGDVDGLSVISPTINDGAATGTPINLTGAVARGFVLSGGNVQGGEFSVNLGAAIGATVSGVQFSATNICNLIASAATNVVVFGNSNVGALVCTLPTLGNNFIDQVNSTVFGFNFTSGIGLPLSTVAGLSATPCNAANKGMLRAVTDATTPTYNGALTGGSTVSVPVYCNGAAWTSH